MHDFYCLAVEWYVATSGPGNTDSHRGPHTVTERADDPRAFRDVFGAKLAGGAGHPGSSQENDSRRFTPQLFPFRGFQRGDQA
jgi:hypothetical protein